MREASPRILREMNTEISSPYRFFFPLAVLWALAGVGAWIFFGAGAIAYPGQFHAGAMVGGFLMSLAVGFLLTAVPKFTGARSCTFGELVVALFLITGQLFFESALPAIFVFLAVFFYRRYRERTYTPPAPFLFIPLGLFFGFLGSLGISLASSGIWTGSVLPFRAMVYQGTLLALVVGIGAKLIRVLLGYEESPLVQLGGTPARTSPVFWVRIHVLILGLGFGLEFVPGTETFGRLLRAWVVSWVAISAWRLYRLPPRRGALTWGLWASGWSLWIGVLAYPFSGVYGIHFLHLVFAGGFGAVGLMVASRVVLAHGGYPIELETRSLSIRFTWILIFSAGFARLGAGFTETGYLRHLQYASILFVLGVLVWTTWMLPKVFPSHSNEL